MIYELEKYRCITNEDAARIIRRELEMRPHASDKFIEDFAASVLARIEKKENKNEK